MANVCQAMKAGRWFVPNWWCLRDRNIIVSTWMISSMKGISPRLALLKSGSMFSISVFQDIVTKTDTVDKHVTSETVADEPVVEDDDAKEGTTDKAKANVVE
ncbi:unnamed protein product [Prunus armeniaca]